MLPQHWHRSEHQCVQPVERPQQQLDARQPTERYGEERSQMKEARLDRREVALRRLKVLHQKRVLVGGPELWRQPAIEVDQRVVPERLDENRASGRTEHTREFGVRSLEVQMVENRDPAHQIEQTIL